MRTRSEFDLLLHTGYSMGDRGALKLILDEAKLQGDMGHLVILGYYRHGPISWNAVSGEIPIYKSFNDYMMNLKKEDPLLSDKDIDDIARQALSDGFLVSWTTGPENEWETIDVWYRTPEEVKQNLIALRGEENIVPLRLQRLFEEQEEGSGEDGEVSPTPPQGGSGGIRSKDVVAIAGLIAAGVAFYYLGFTGGEKKS